MPPSHRPQTLKQARRAYQKNGPARPSASDIAQAERRAALQERADRINEREARRKANLKKKDEKIAREREAAKKAGKPFLEDQKHRWRVGASQLRLGGFLNGIQKLREPDHRKLHQAKDIGEDTVKTVPRDQAEPDLCHIQCDSPTEASLGTSAEKLACNPLVLESLICSAHQMPPPLTRPLPRQGEMLDETLEDCFPSNTQIQRELSSQFCKATAAFNTANPNSLCKYAATNGNSRDATETNDLLDCISTQDPNLSSTPNAPVAKHDELDLLAQISTQDLEIGDSSLKSVTPANSTDPELLLAQISTQDLILSQELIDVRTEIQSADSESFTDVDIDSFVTECGVDDFESTLLDLGPVC